MALDARTYRCDCEEGYSGALCNQRVESVNSCRGALQCVHGQCEQTEGGDRCICEQGFTGQNCDIGERGRKRIDTPVRLERTSSDCLVGV